MGNFGKAGTYSSLILFLHERLPPTQPTPAATSRQPLTAIAIRLNVLVRGLSARQVSEVEQEPQHLDQCALGRRLLAAQHQNGIRTDRPRTAVSLVSIR
jgi:hypothetical protein